MSAPRFRSLNQLTGEVSGRPSTFMKALSEADSLCRELDDLRALQCRVDELVAENRELRLLLAQARTQRDAYRMSGDAR